MSEDKLTLGGPLITYMSAYSDFLSYSSGIYQLPNGQEVCFKYGFF